MNRHRKQQLASTELLNHNYSQSYVAVAKPGEGGAGERHWARQEEEDLLRILIREGLDRDSVIGAGESWLAAQATPWRAGGRAQEGVERRMGIGGAAGMRLCLSERMSKKTE